jgi:hypothetical protein
MRLRISPFSGKETPTVDLVGGRRTETIRRWSRW